jgi:hypothetical protein
MIFCYYLFAERPTRWTSFRRFGISFSQGAEWKALINKYIGTIPLRGDALTAVEQSIFGGPPPRRAVSSAMIAKVGAAARHSQSAAPSAPMFAFSSRIAVEARPPVYASLMSRSCIKARLGHDNRDLAQPLLYSSWRRHQ